MPNLDPATMMQVTQALQRLPKGQLQRLQGIMQKAMSGKDVSREAAEFERTLPPDFQNLMQSLAATMGGMGGNLGGGLPAAEAPTGAPDAGLSVEEARKIVEKAAAEGKISADQATELLSAAQTDQSAPAGEKKGFGKLWGKITGKAK